MLVTATVGKSPLQVHYLFLRLALFRLYMGTRTYGSNSKNFWRSEFCLCLRSLCEEGKVCMGSCHRNSALVPVATHPYLFRLETPTSPRFCFSTIRGQLFLRASAVSTDSSWFLLLYGVIRGVTAKRTWQHAYVVFFHVRHAEF